jgi:glucose-6-phosphate isomerase
MKLRQNKLVPLTLEDRPGVASGPSWSGSGAQEYRELIDRLEAIRMDWLQSDGHGEPEPICIALPGAMLGEYAARRDSSRLAKVFSMANHLQSQTDRVIFIGSSDSHRVIRTFFEACCDPYWNELTRGERGSKPRVYFAGDSIDNDSIQGLLQLLSADRPANRHEVYSIGAVSLRSWDIPAGFDVVHRYLHQNFHSTEKGFLLYECSPSPFSESNESYQIISALLPFTELGMLPAATLGIKIMELLAGASAVSKLFFSTVGAENPILRWVAWNQIANIRSMAIWNPSLIAGARWHSHLTQRLGSVSNNPSDPWRFLDSSRVGLSDQDLGNCSHIWVDQTRYDALACEPGPTGDAVWDPNSDRPRRISPVGPTGPTCPDIHRGIYQETLQRQSERAGLGVTLNLPDLGELSLGQWMQWMIIASLLELALAQDT